MRTFDGIAIDHDVSESGENLFYNLSGDKGNRHTFSFRDPAITIRCSILNAGPHPVEVEYRVHDQSNAVTMTVPARSEGAYVSNAWACKVGPTELNPEFRAVGWVDVKSKSASRNET